MPYIQEELKELLDLLVEHAATDLQYLRILRGDIRLQNYVRLLVRLDEMGKNYNPASLVQKTIVEALSDAERVAFRDLNKRRHGLRDCIIKSLESLDRHPNISLPATLRYTLNWESDGYCVAKEEICLTLERMNGEQLSHKEEDQSNWWTVGYAAEKSEESAADISQACASPRKKFDWVGDGLARRVEPKGVMEWAKKRQAARDARDSRRMGSNIVKPRLRK